MSNVSAKGRNRRARCAVAVVVGACFAVAACDGGLRPRRRFNEEGEALIGGTYTYERPEIGAIDGCTATLVGPRLVVTAAHCVDFATYDRPGAYNTFVVDDGRRTYRYPVDRVASFGWDAGDDDVALLHLGTAVPAIVATPAGVASAMPPDGTPVSIFGYGCQRRSGGGAFEKQRFDRALGEPTYSLCPGDSGGPTLSPDGLVLRVNSAYIVGPGDDIFGDVTRHADDIAAQALAWGETLEPRTPGDGVAPPEDPTPPAPDPGIAPEDPGTPEDPPADPGEPPADPETPTDCDAASRCEEATPLAGCGWCGATGESVAVDGCGYPIDDCPGDFRLSPEDCDGGAGTAACVCVDGVHFAGCGLECPEGSYCIPGTTALECWGF